LVFFFAGTDAPVDPVVRAEPAVFEGRRTNACPPPVFVVFTSFLLRCFLGNWLPLSGTTDSTFRPLVFGASRRVFVGAEGSPYAERSRSDFGVVV
jgi:hypothetical protein